MTGRAFWGNSQKDGVVVAIRCYIVDVKKVAACFAFVPKLLAASAEKPRRVYLKFKAVFDRAAGVVMTVLGLKLIFGMK